MSGACRKRESSYLRVKGRRYNQFVKIPSFTHKIPIDLRGMKSIILEVINTYTSKVDISLNAISRQLSRDDSLENNLHVRNLQSFLRIQCQGFKQKPHAILSLSFFSQEKENSTWHCIFSNFIFWLNSQHFHTLKGDETLTIFVIQHTCSLNYISTLYFNLFPKY